MKKTVIKQFFLFFAVLLVGLIAAALLVIWKDPFFVYHAPKQADAYRIDNQLSQNPGIAKHFVYDSIVLGSSMTVSFDTDYMEALTGLRTIKLSYNGAFPKDCSNILKVVNRSDNDVKRVYWGVDIHTWVGGSETMAYPIPEYLYDTNPFNDVAYLWNKEVILQYVLKSGEKVALKDIYSYVHVSTFGRANALAQYARPEPSEKLSETTYLTAIKDNMETNVFPFVENMADTEFIFFFPPYSVLYWDSRELQGQAEAFFEGEKYIAESLLQYPNVRVFYFQDDWDTVTDLDRYCDYYHYDLSVCNKMCDSFANGSCEMRRADAAERIDDLREKLTPMLPLDLEKVAVEGVQRE